MERVVYDAFRTGQDGKFLGIVSAIVFIDILIVWYSLTVARARRNGPLTSRNPLTATIMNRTGGNLVGVLTTTGLVSITLIVLLLIGYWHDRVLFAKGRYMTVVGKLEQDIAIKFAAPQRSSQRSRLITQFAMEPPEQHEWDQLVVEGKTFVVECIRPGEASLGVVGSAGACLNQAQIGRKMRVDYLPYRVEPLRIEVLN